MEIKITYAFTSTDGQRVWRLTEDKHYLEYLIAEREDEFVIEAEYGGYDYTTAEMRQILDAIDDFKAKLNVD